MHCMHAVKSPFPAPVATVGVDRGDNGAILAGQLVQLMIMKLRIYLN